MEVRALLSVTILLLGVITYIIKAWINEVKVDLKEMSKKQHELDISLTRLQTSVSIHDKEGE